MSLVLLFILVIAAPLIGAVVWLIARRRPAPGAWLAIMQVHGPLLLGVHLLIFTAAMLGMRLPGNAIFDVSTFDQAQMPIKMYSEWAIDFWFGPAVVCFTFLALIAFLSTTASDRWAQWRGDILLISGLIIGFAILAFAMHYCPLAMSHLVFIPDADLHYVTTPGGTIQAITIPSGLFVTRALQSGLVLALLPVFLLIVGGVLIVNFPGVPYRQPRLSRFAAWGVLSVFPCWPLVPIFGTIAIVQIKRSGGKIYGLRLAAVEALIIPWILITGAIGGAFTAIVFAFFKIVAALTRDPGGPPHDAAFAPQQNVAVAPQRDVAFAGPILISIIPALVIGFFVNRALWRAIVGRPARPEWPVSAPRAARSGTAWVGIVSLCLSIGGIALPTLLPFIALNAAGLRLAPGIWMMLGLLLELAALICGVIGRATVAAKAGLAIGAVCAVVGIVVLLSGNGPDHAGQPPPDSNAPTVVPTPQPYNP